MGSKLPIFRGNLQLFALNKGNLKKGNIEKKQRKKDACLQAIMHHPFRTSKVTRKSDCMQRKEGWLRDKSCKKQQKHLTSLSISHREFRIPWDRADSQGVVLSKKAFLAPSGSPPSKNPFWGPLKNHYKTPSKNLVENFLQSPFQNLRTLFSEPLESRVLSHDPLGVHPIDRTLQSWSCTAFSPCFLRPHENWPESSLPWEWIAMTYAVVCDQNRQGCAIWVRSSSVRDIYHVMHSFSVKNHPEFWTPKSSHRMTFCWVLKTSTLGMTSCDVGQPNSRVKVAEGFFLIRWRILAANQPLYFYMLYIYIYICCRLR